MGNPTTPTTITPAYIPFTEGRDQGFIMDRLQRNLLHIANDDDSKKTLIVNIFDFINRMRKIGENFGINQPPQTDIENIDTMIAAITRGIEQLRTAGKDKQLLADSYALKLDNIKLENSQYCDQRDEKIRQYNSILADLSALRATLGSHIPTDNEIQAARQKLDAQTKTLGTINRDLSHLDNTRITIEGTARHLKDQVKRDVSVGLGGPQIPTLK